MIWLKRYNRLQLKLGYSIGMNVFSYGLIIPHNGTIVVGSNNKIGKYAVLHTSTCIVNQNSLIGDAFYLSTGAKVISRVELGDNVRVGSNGVVYNVHDCDNVLLVGIPATIKKKSEPWYLSDGKEYQKRVLEVETLRKKLGL